MDPVTRQQYADSRQYERDCAAKFAELCPDGIPTPEWEKWILEMDAYNAGMTVPQWKAALKEQGAAFE